MRKICFSCFIILLILVITLPCFAAEADFFYYDHSDPTLNQALQRLKESQLIIDKRFLETYYLPEGQPADDAKIAHGTDEIFCDYQWNGQRLVDFLSARDKKAFLDQMEVMYYIYPCYYDGVMIPYKEQIRYYADLQNYRMVAAGGPVYHTEYLTMTNKTTLLQEMAKDNLDDYTPLLSLNLDQLWFVYAEKDNVNYVIYMPTEGDLTNSNYNGIVQKHSYLSEQRVLSIEKAKAFFADFQAMIDEASQKHDGYTNGTDLTTGTETEDDEDINNHLLWWIVGGTVIAVALTVILLLILKKKRA